MSSTEIPKFGEHIRFNSEEATPKIQRDVARLVQGTFEFFGIKNDELAISAFYNTVRALAQVNEGVKLFLSPEYQRLMREQERYKGPCELAIKACSDGRVNIPVVLGTHVKFSKSKAGHVPVKVDAQGGHYRTKIIHERFARSIITRAAHGPLLQYLLAHSGFQGTHRDICAANAAQIAKLKHPPSDPVLFNLRGLRMGVKAINSLFNQAAKKFSKNEQDMVADTAVFNTDTMGMIFGYGEKEKLDTTDVAKMLTPLIKKLTDLPPRVVGDFTESEQFIQLERYITALLPILMGETTNDQEQEIHGRFMDFVGQYAFNNLKKMTQDQLQAFFFLNARVVAFQVGAKLYKKDIEHHHQEHGEKFIALTKDGFTAGHLSLRQGALAVATGQYEDAVETTNLLTGVLEKTTDGHPYVVLITSEGPMNQVVAAENRERYHQIVSHKDIRPRIEKGEVIFVPVIVDSNGSITNIMWTHTIA